MTVGLSTGMVTKALPPPFSLMLTAALTARVKAPLCCPQNCSLRALVVDAGLPVVTGDSALPPVAPPAAPVAPVPPPAAPRKHVELLLVQNPGDDVCFAKEDEQRASQQAFRH